MQFEVFPNPVPRARAQFPYVAVLQADIAGTDRHRLVAPLAPRAGTQGLGRRLSPSMTVLGVEHVLLVPSLAAVPTASLKGSVGSIAAHRDAITAALDYLFQGV